MPSKRERGKQRKAAKSLAAASGAINVSKTVALLRKGDNDATVLLGDGSLEESNGISYEQSGILSTVLKFLKRCEDDTFVKVMLGISGDLKTPRSWVRVLIKAEAQEENCRLQIAQSIGPLVRCMCNDTTRLFFKSNKHWVNTIHPFFCLIHNMILHSADNSDKTEGKKIINTLLQHEGLLTSIIQWAFWKEEFRPDIAEELKNDDLLDIVESGKASVSRLIKSADIEIEQDRKRLEVICTTPIISKEYDPECRISAVVELIRQVKIKGWTMDASIFLQRLTANVGCVDKNVIIEMIDLGMDTSNDKWVAHVAELLRFMILKENSDGMFYSNDTKDAFAVRGGLIELCLTFIERFGVLESFHEERHNASSPFASIKGILSNIYWVGLHKKTAKAIRSKRSSIEQELARLGQNTDITNNAKCKELIEITRSILDTNGSYCCRCNKPLSRTEVKLCNGCGCMVYCSRACQKQDWSNGHKLTCCKTYTNDISAQYQGRFKPIVMPENERAAQKIREIEINMSMIQLKLFLDHKESILSQVEALGIPIYDCIVSFDLTKCPLEITTHRYTDFYDTPELMRVFGDSRSKENIACIFISSIYDGSLDGGQIPTLKMQRLFPHEWLSKRKAHEINKDDNRIDCGLN